MGQLICRTADSPLMPSVTTQNQWPAFTPGIWTRLRAPTELVTTAWTLLVAQPSRFVSKVSLVERPVLLQHPLAHREHPVRGNGLSPPVV